MTAVSSPSWTRRRTSVLAVAAMASLPLAACGGDDARGEPTAPATTPAVEATAPPSLTPEEQTAAQLEAMYVEIVAAVDGLAARASSFEDPVWNHEEADEIAATLAEAGATDIASSDLASKVIVLNATGLNARGSSVVEAFDATVHLSPIDGQTNEPSAHATACVDNSAVELVDAETGEPNGAPHAEGDGLRQQLTFYYLDEARDALGKRLGDEGWYLTVIEEEVVREC